ncbi:MAG: M23 family metallopeptidase [Bacteroidales bacterium]|nr:M23 family metallopeptidase [Lentimicrobiaceae bacterium]MBQ2852792.1 M23 family metallopeptidase [Bacteroidales bacterium]MBR7176000.1 M23 family metallopeptidase [Bacteroidales bacterium]
MSEKRKKLKEKLHKKYRIVIYNYDTHEERFHFRLTRMNAIGIVIVSMLLLIILTTYIIAFTPLREYIPGYTDVSLNKRVYEMERRADSLEIIFQQKDQYINNIKRIIMDDDFTTDSVNSLLTQSSNTDFNNITIKKSKEDSIFRANFEIETRNNLFNSPIMSDITADLKIVSFYSPIDGIVTNHFDRANKHYGTDLVASNNAVIKATADGTVIYSGWSVDNGYCIGIQHNGNLLSFYKHNAVLLKEEGEYVSAGDPIAIYGNSGSLSTGPHLHFELWYNGTPLNPEDYISFDSNN